MRPLLDRLKDGDVLLADGAMGTMLMASGLSPGECTEAVNIERPQVLQQIAASYIDAGADIIQTNTFGASPLRLAHYSLHERMEEINVAAVQAARQASRNRTYVCASCGPCGRILQPYGDTDPADVADSFKRQLAVLIAEGVDLICVETMTDLTEATLAVKAAKAISPGTPVSATMTFDDTPNGFFTVMGVTVEQAVTGLTTAGADILGSNCGYGITHMVRLAAEFRRHTELPLLIQANAGLPEIEGDTLIYPETPEYMAEKCRELITIGVNIIGGCCGTTPEHIGAIRKVIDELH
ncbi:MAG: homocysteine S-methyltransferase family protein [bacterium]